MKPDSASDLVVAYLRVNDYFVLTDLEFHLWEDGAYRAVTDVDIVAVRHRNPTGSTHYRDAAGVVECALAGEVDPALAVATDRCDVIIGEVKRGGAEFNPALRDPRVLHGVSRRIGDVFGDFADDSIDELAATGRVQTPWAQVRLVAFGDRGSVRGGTAMSHAHLVDWLNDVVGRHHDLFEITTFSDPVLSFLGFMSRLGSVNSLRPMNQR